MNFFEKRKEELRKNLISSFIDIEKANKPLPEGGEWKTINGSKVYILNGKPVAGAGGNLGDDKKGGKDSGEVTLKTFEDLALSAKSAEELYEKVGKIKNVPTDAATQFFNKYGEGGEISPMEATKRLFEHIKETGEKNWETGDLKFRRSVSEGNNQQMISVFRKEGKGHVNIGTISKKYMDKKKLDFNNKKDVENYQKTYM